MITLVDIDRQWFKSRIGLHLSETHRDCAFCAYVVLEDTPDAMVVLDAKKDPRFQSNPLVTGPPFIRFYAGAALYVDEVKLGSFCIMDSSPRESFDLKQQMSLIDMGAMVAHVISQRRVKMMDTENDLARLSMSIAYSLKFPLVELTLQSRKLNSLFEEMNGVINQDKVSEDEQTVLLKPLAVEFNRVIDEFRHGIDFQRLLIEASLALGQSFVSHESKGGDPTDMKHIVNMEKTSVVEVLNGIRYMVEKSYPQIQFEMTINRKQFPPNSCQLSYPDLIKLISFATVFTIMRESFMSFDLAVSFVEGYTDSNNNNSNNNNNDEEDSSDEDEIVREFVDQGLEIMRGRVVLVFTCNSKKSMQTLMVEGDNSPSDCDISDYEKFDMRIFDDVLRCVGASYKIYITKRTAATTPAVSRRESAGGGAVCHELSVPCLIPIPKRQQVTPIYFPPSSNVIILFMTFDDKLESF